LNNCNQQADNQETEFENREAQLAPAGTQHLGDLKVMMMHMGDVSHAHHHCF